MRENDQSLLQVFNDLSHILLKSRSSDDALSSIAKLCRNVLNSQYCIISRVYTEGRFLVTVACSGSDDEFEKFILGKKFDKENKYIDFDLVFKGEKIEVYDIHKNGQGVANPDIANLFDLQSLLSYPLKVGEHLVGYINHFSSNNSQFTEYDKKVLEIFANQAVLAIDFLDRKFHEVAEARQEIMRLDDEEAVWDYVVKSAGKLTGAPWVCIGKLDYKTGSLQIVRTTKAIPKDCEFFTNRDSEKSVMVKSIKDGKTILINDLEGKEHLKWGGEPSGSEIAVPIVVNKVQIREGKDVKTSSKPIGVINVESSQIGAFSQAEQESLESLAFYAAMAIEKLEYKRKLIGLHEIEKKIVERGNFNSIVEELLEDITLVLDFELLNVSLVTVDGQRIKTEYIKGIPEDENERVEFKRLADHKLDSNDIQADIIRSGQIEVPSINDSRFDPKIYDRFNHKTFIRVFIPMIVSSEKRPIGTIEAGYKADIRKHIYEQDVQILKMFADYLAHAFEQKRLVSLDKICHELRSPIVGIRSHAEFLNKLWKLLDQELIKRKLEDIIADCELLLYGVADIEIAFGRKPKPSKKEKINVGRDVIIKTVMQLKPYINFVQFDLIDLKKIEVYVDRAKLNQVVFNLFQNAIKYCEEDKEKFRVKIEADIDNTNFIIKFKDWGIGIAAGFEEKIFESGFRTSEAKQRDVNGSGFGLTISRELMKEMGGDLRLVNSYKPTEFHLIIPKF